MGIAGLILRRLDLVERLASIADQLIHLLRMRIILLIGAADRGSPLLEPGPRSRTGIKFMPRWIADAHVVGHLRHRSVAEQGIEARDGRFQVQRIERDPIQCCTCVVPCADAVELDNEDHLYLQLSGLSGRTSQASLGRSRLSLPDGWRPPFSDAFAYLGFA